jgi:hypothetical protein
LLGSEDSEGDVNEETHNSTAPDVGLDQVDRAALIRWGRGLSCHPLVTRSDNMRCYLM